MNLREFPFCLNEKQLAWVENTLKELSLDEKAGQLFCVMGGAYEAQELKRLVSDYHIGGVLLKADTTDAIRKKYAELDVCAKIPLLKAANLEEGGVGAVTDGTHFGSQMLVAAAHDPECIRQFARACALEGGRAGINWSFSPVVDVDYNFRNPITNVRTFGSDPDVVLENALLCVEEIQKNAMAAACKHFPGDGVDYRDQHLHPTYNDLSEQEWYASYGKIYRALIEKGVLSIMAGHIVAPHVIRGIDPDAEALPASLSREMLTGVLRKRLGFEGLIITDATVMGGYTMAMERRRAIPGSIQAGCDMICFSTDIYEDIEFVKKGIEDGILTRERLDDAVRRILALKAKVTNAVGEMKESRDCLEATAAAEEGDAQNRAGAAQVRTAAAQVRTAATQNRAGAAQVKTAATQNRAAAAHWSRVCAEKGVTLVKDTQRLIPVCPDVYGRIRLVVLGQDAIADGSLKAIAGEILTENGFLVEYYDPMSDDLHGSGKLPKDRLTLILANFPTAANNTAVRVSWCPKHAMELPRFIHEERTAFISFANPYHLQDVPRVRTYVNAYGATENTIRAAIEKLTGKSEFEGISPVDAFCGLADARY